MSTFTNNDVNSGATVFASDHNEQGSRIAAVLNGGIDNANINASAAIATSKLADDAGITDAKIASGALKTNKINNPYKFRVYRSAAQNTGNSAFAIINHDTKSFDTGSNVDIVTNKGRFTAPVAGFWYLTAQAAIVSSSNDFLIVLYKNGSLMSYGGRSKLSSAINNQVVSDFVQLSANDYIEVYTFCSATTALEVSNGAAENFFAGFLVSGT